MTRLETSRLAWGLCAAFFILLIGVEASYAMPEEGALRAAAAWTWIALSVIVLGSALVVSVRPFLSRGFWSSADLGWYLAAFFVPIALVLFDLGGCTFTQINAEGVQQVVNGLGLLSGRRDLGLFSFAFLGYPSRHFLLAALPSWMFGRGLVTLRLGFGGLYLLGYVAFLSGLWRYLEARKAARPMLAASLSGMLVSLGTYPLLFARLFEQATVPLSATLLFFAGLLLFLRRPGPIASLGFIWALGFMPYSYTPSLAAWVLGMAVLAYLSISGITDQKAPLAAGLIYGAVAMAVSAVARGHANPFPLSLAVGTYSDGAAAGFADASAGAWTARFLGGLHATVGIEECLVPAPLALGILFILVHSLRRREFRVLYICLWAAGTVALSLALKGYWQRVPEFDIQRAMVILPPLSLALAIYVAANFDMGRIGAEGNAARALVISGILFMLLNSAYLPLIRRVPRAYFPFEITDQEEATMLVLGKAGAGAKTVYLAPPLYFPLEESLAYFAPATRVLHGVPPGGEHLPGVYVISCIGKEPYVGEDPAAVFADHPVRYAAPRPYLSIRPE